MTPRLRRLFALALSCLTLLSSPPAALAWKPSMHMYLAMEAVEDALRTGKVTIKRVNYETGRELGVVGEYAVDEVTLEALRANTGQFLAGVIGPDAYPDIVTGQTAIHPVDHGARYKNAAYGSDAWLQYLWERALDPGLSAAERLPARAFVVGYLTHAAGDSYAHTFVNYYAGGPFKPGGNAVKHIVLEGYIGDRAPTGGPYRVSIEGAEDFISRTLVRAEPDTPLMGLLEGTGEGAGRVKQTALALSFVPLTFARLRAQLVGRRQGLPERLARRADEWVGYIDEGLAAWAPLSHALGEALFYSDGYDKANVARAEELIKEYTDKHLNKMLFGYVGAKVEEFEELAERVVPEPVRERLRKLRTKVKELRNDLLKLLYRIATRGKELDDLKKYLTSPATYVKSELTRKCKTEADLARKKGKGKGKVEAVCLEHEELDRLLGVTHNGEDKLSYEKFAPAYNTVLMTKLLLLDSKEMNRLLGDLGATAGPGRGPALLGLPNAMLGFNKSLDGDNQWEANGLGYQMALVRGLVYDQLFKRQKGEHNDIASYLLMKAALYRLGERRAEPARTRDGEGWAQPFEGGRVYWSPGNGVRPMQGAILAKWDAGGGEAGPLGFPVSDPLRPKGAHGDDWYQFFERGAIYWPAAADTALTLIRIPERAPAPEDPAASILRKAESFGLGGPDPLTPAPQAMAGDTGWWQRFAGGRVYWSAEGGPRWLSEPMWEAWAPAAASLGSPVTDELKAEGGGEHDRYQFFTRGVIYLRADSKPARIAYLRP